MDIPGLDEMLGIFDGDGDGEVEMPEWLARMPIEFRASVRKLGLELLQGKAPKTGNAKFAAEDSRGQNQREWQEQRDQNRKNQRDDSIVGGHIASIHSKKLDTQSLFREYDTDMSGNLTKRELRQALGSLRVAETTGMPMATNQGERDTMGFRGLT